MPCLQLLLFFTALIVEMCGLMGEASKVYNPWIALQLLKLNAVYGYAIKWKPTSVKDESTQNLSKSGVTLVASNSLTKVVHRDYHLEQHELSLAKHLARIRRHRRAIMKWKAAAHKITCFSPNLLLHREITILNAALYHELIVYAPVLIGVATSLVVICIFFPVRFDPDFVVAFPCWVVALTVAGILLFLVPAGALVARASFRFHLFWKQRLRLAVNRRQLRSCRHIAIWIGPFGHFDQQTLLGIFHVIFNYLGTLLINL